MEERHKRSLRRNRVRLVKELEPNRLYEGLVEKGLFTKDMIQEIQLSGTNRDQSRQLVRDLETRGSQAFPIFLKCLVETGQKSLAQLLQNGASTVIQPVPAAVPAGPIIQPLPILPSGVDEHRRDDAPVKTLVITPSPSFEGGSIRPSWPRRDSIPSYKMDASPCGVCLIINNVTFDPRSSLSNRKGSSIDCKKLERRFTSFNFIVDVKTNLKQRQIIHELSTLRKKDHSQYDCCVVIMLSHGTEVNHSRFPGAVYGVDGLYIPVQQITNYLNGQNCPSLQGKPKLFFIQACGGAEKDRGVEVSSDDLEPSFGESDNETDAIPTSSSSDSLSMSDEPDARTTLPIPSDILVSYSTFPGYVSWRDTESGSWYVETLDRILEETASTNDLSRMLMMVNDEVSQNSAKGIYKQMPGSFNFLRKLLFFQCQTQHDMT